MKCAKQTCTFIASNFPEQKMSRPFFLYSPQPSSHLHNIYTVRRAFLLATLLAIPQSHPAIMLPASSSRRSQLLEWFPFYVHRLTTDVRYRALKDYHQAWYLNLMFASWVSARPGYLPDDGQLWRLANARTRQFFEKESEPVLCMFEREGSATDGAVWIYNRAMVEIYDEQVLKFHKKSRRSSKSTSDELTSYLDFEGTLKKENGKQECALHPESGRTQWGTCWECYAAKYSAV
jgi:hypothetical protein